MLGTQLSRSATVLSCPRFRFHAMTTPKLDHRPLSIEPIEAYAALVVRFVSSYKVIYGATYQLNLNKGVRSRITPLIG
jgi:hypothetical protein